MAPRPAYANADIVNIGADEDGRRTLAAPTRARRATSCARWKKRASHAAYAKALASRDIAGTAAELARHARASHDLVTATTASIQAGDEAMAVGGPDEAASHYELALELATDPEVANAVGLASGGFDQVGLAVRASAAAAAAGHLFRAIALAVYRV